MVVVVPTNPLIEEDIFMVTPTSIPVPANLGWVTDVILSVLEVPESKPPIRSGVPGVVGAWVSTVKLVIDSGDEAFPPASVTVTVQLL